MSVYNRYAKDKRYAGLLFQDRQFIETGEWNEMQSIHGERDQSIGDAAFGAVSVRSGGAIFIDPIAKTIQIGEAKVWAGGYMHPVNEALITVASFDGTIVIGVAVDEIEITADQDPGLKGIVPAVPSQGERLASRLRYDAQWDTEGDPFYPVFTIVEGVLQNESVTRNDNPAELAVENHIRQTHGSHVVEGFDVLPGGYNAGTNEQTLIIRSGILRAEGREVRRTVDQRFRRVENPSLVTVNGESHTYPAGGVVTLNNGPIESISVATVVKRVVANITHQVAGGADAVPNTPIYEIETVKQGSKTYVTPGDFIRTGDTINWSPAGDEPSPGSTYEVTYLYTATVTPTAVGRQTVTLEPAVVGKPVIINYRWKLPRIDAVAINLDGEVIYLEGVSSRFNPVPPFIPTPLAPLARVTNLWGIDPIIDDIDQRKLTEADTRALLRTVLNMQDLLSLVMLEKDVQERDPASRRGSFVDPFTSDLQRDLGIAQDAAIVDGILMLPIVVTPMQVDIGSVAIMLPFTKETILSQPFRTNSQKINEFQAFDPLPAPLTVKPAVDRWNDVSKSTTSRATESVTRVNSYRPDLVGTPLYGTSSSASRTSQSTRLASRETTDLEFLRRITLELNGRLFAPNETITRVTFDGIDVTSILTGTKKANAQGLFTGTFVIPENVRSGTKEIVVTGSSGTRSITSFTGQGTLTKERYVTTTHTSTVVTTIDPVAQSFILSEPRQIMGVRVEFTKRGDPNKQVVLEMRPLEGSTPSAVTLTEGLIGGNFAIGDPLVDTPSNWTELDFTFPQLVPADDWRAFALLTDDAEHSVAIAELGSQADEDSPRGYDPRKQQWIRRNPAGGDLFKGSNGKSWLVVPNADLTHEIIAYRFTALSRVVPIGTFNLATISATGISDVLVLLIIEEPSEDTRVVLELVRASGEVIRFEPGVRLPFDDYLTEIVSIRMVLTGTEKLSPVIMPECQILWGRMKETATYVSEAIDIDRRNGNVKIRSVYEVNAPGTSSIKLEVGAVGAFVEQGNAITASLGDGWVEREHIQTPYTAAQAREKITLTGTPRFRPRARNLRARATEV